MTQVFKEMKRKHGKKTILAYLNINSYRYKSCNVMELLNGRYWDMMCIAETKLDESFPDSQFHCNEYTMYRRDGPSSSSGGLIVYVSSSVSSRRRKDLEPPNTECIVIQQIHNKKKALFFICYRAPRNNAQSYLHALSLSIDKALCENNIITVIGNLNQNMLQSTASKDLQLTTKLLAPTPVFPLNSSIAPTPKPCY